MALYETGKLDPPDIAELNRPDPGWPVSVDILLDTYWHYRIHHQLPQAGGVLDQDQYIMEAFRMLDMQVEWWKLNEKKQTNLPDYDEWQKKRREAHQKRG